LDAYKKAPPVGVKHKSKYMIIKKATLENLHLLTILFDEYRIFYRMESDIIKAREFLAERINKNQSEIFVAETINKTLAGFIQLYPIFSSTRMKRLWLLNDLYVNPNYRGQNISVLLIDKAKELSNNTESAGLILETAKSNFIGNKLYLQTDFKLDEDHNYYSWNK
jgi:ribosomal protein S18 acetylase RimI-like enzyme